MTHAQCWTHTRRQFIKAENKRRCRVEQAKPVVERLFAWAEAQLAHQAFLPSNPLTKALGYLLHRRAGLEVYLGDPEVPVDTNHLERALGVIPMGRKNFLFAWTEVGAKDVGVLDSLLITCRMHAVNPYDYLVDVLQRVGQHPASEVHLLTPRLWKQHFANNPLRSPLQTLRD